MSIRVHIVKEIMYEKEPIFSMNDVKIQKYFPYDFFEKLKDGVGLTTLDRGDVEYAIEKARQNKDTEIQELFEDILAVMTKKEVDYLELYLF